MLQCFTDDNDRLCPAALLNAGSMLDWFYHMVIILDVRTNALNINVRLRDTSKLVIISIIGMTKGFYCLT